MRSRTSLYNKGFGLHLLRRFWPLWTLWLAALLLAGPLAITGNRPESYARAAEYVNELNRALLQSGVLLAYAAVAAGALVAMAMLSYLYNPRNCGMVNALPMRREEAYLTAFLTGLVPMLAADVLVFLLMLGLFGGVEGVERAHIATWFGTVLMSNTAFYGMACFCGLLTGQVAVLPAVYVVLNCAATVAEGAVRALFGTIVYGYSYNGYSLGWLSPLPQMVMTLRVIGERSGKLGELPVYHLGGTAYLAALCALGLALPLLGLPILRRRQMESAGEIVAVPVLRPIFRLCMAVGTAIVFACLMCEGIVSRMLAGTALAAAVILLLCVGAALGWFAAEMLMKKTLRVFGRGWKQLGVLCVCLAAVAILAEYDAVGYEKRVPDPAEVESVFLPLNGLTLREPESIESYCRFHREIIAHKAENEAARTQRYWIMTVSYSLRDGSVFSRNYRLINDERTQNDPASDLAHYEALCNLPEAILQRAGAGRTVREETVRYASVDILRPMDGGYGWTSEQLRLSAEQAVSLYQQGILPDAKAGAIARWYLSDSEESRSEDTNVHINIELMRDGDAAAVQEYTFSDYISVSVLASSEHTQRWLREHLNVEPENRHALEQTLRQDEAVIPIPAY